MNYSTAHVGGCQVQLAPGNEVLWAFNYFNLPHLLSLSGPSSANLGTPFVVRVVDGATGEPLAGATVGEDVSGVTTPLPGSPTTNAAGEAAVQLTHEGTVSLKATRPESVRSGALAVCVHNGEDGTCGTHIPVVCPESSPGCGLARFPGTGPAPTVEVLAAGVIPGHRYAPRHAPRILEGRVTLPDGATLKEVRISLERRRGRRCWVFNGTRGRFVRSRCGHPRFFSVGDSESFSYLLPSRLPRGRYTYEVEALVASGPGRLTPRVNDVTFRVA